MPRSSRHKSHKQSKHSTKEVKEFSDSEGENVKMKDGSSCKGAKDSCHSVSGEKRKLVSQLKDGNDLSCHGNGEASEEYVSSKRRKEKVETSAGGDRWIGGGDERAESGGMEKEHRGETSKFDGEKGSKSRELSRSKGSRRHESGGERKEENVGSVAEKEDSRSGIRSESRRKSEKEKECTELKEVREKERGSEREKRSRESRRDSEVCIVDGDVIKKQGLQLDDFGEDKQGRKSRNDTEWHMQEDLRKHEQEKEPEKRARKRREGSGDEDKYKDNYRDSDGKQLPSRGDRVKEGKYRDDVYQEDGDRNDRQRDAKYREDAERDSRHRDDKYRDDGDRDSRRRDNKCREDGDRDSRRRDDKYREDGEKDSRRREDKYREDGERESRRKCREDGHKESRSSDIRYHDDADRDGKQKDEKNRDDVDRDSRHKAEKHRDNHERESRQRDGQQVDDVDRDKRLREGKFRDERGSKDRSSDKLVTKRSRDENHAADIHSRKSSMHDENPGYDDRVTRYKDDQGRRKISDKEEHSDFRSRSTKDQLSYVDKRSACSGRLGLVTDRGKSSSRIADNDVAATYSRRRSPSSSSRIARDPYRLSKQDESKYRDYAYDERTRISLTSSREYSAAAAAAAAASEKKLLQKDDGYFGEATERRMRSSARSSPLPLMDKSPSSTSAERRHLGRSDVRRNVDVEETGQRSGGSRDGKDCSGRDGRGSREVALENFQGDEISQADVDNYSVSSPFTKISHLSGNSKSLLPHPSFRSGVDSPSQFGVSEDDNRSKSNSRHRRIGDPTSIGRVQSNSWRGVPNWPSPMANGFMPFQHGPPPVGFHHVMQQFPAPPIFGVRPSMELNHPGVPYHVPDAERFSGHSRPVGWRNPVDDSCPPLHGWDANNAVYGEDPHLFGRPDWDNGRSIHGGRSWETSGDMWKGPNSSGSSELLSAPIKENHLTPGGVDDSLADRSDEQARVEESQPDLQDNSNETSQPTDVPGKKRPELPKKDPEGTFVVDEKSERDDGRLFHFYLSKLDISADLTEPELYVQCTGLVDTDNSSINDVLYTGLLEEPLKDRVTTTSRIPSTLLFAAADGSVYQKAMTLYKKHKEEFKVTSEDSLASFSMKNEPTVESTEENLGSTADEQETENVLPKFSKEVELPASFENLGACATANENVAADNVIDRSEDSFLEAMEHTTIDKDFMATKSVERATNHSPARFEDLVPDISITDLSASNNEQKDLIGTKFGPLLYSVAPPEACEGVIAESVESGQVNLSGIHHSPESTR